MSYPNNSTSDKCKNLSSILQSQIGLDINIVYIFILNRDPIKPIQ